MTPALRRTNFNSSRFIRLLSDLTLADGVESPQAFAQRLGQWVSFTDAMTLYAALDSSTAPTVGKPSAGHAGRTSVAHRAVNDEWARVRASMVDVINRSCSTSPGTARIKFPVPSSDASPDLAISYTPFHRFYLALQREMEAKATPLRAAVREALATASPALQQLAALDAALDQILAERERRLFSTVPLLLEKRFAQLRSTHQPTLGGGGPSDDPAAWMQSGAWLARFREELCGTLLAEWDVRLQPAMGLMEAFSNEVDGQT